MYVYVYVHTNTKKFAIDLKAQLNDSIFLSFF